MGRGVHVLRAQYLFVGKTAKPNPAIYQTVVTQGSLATPMGLLTSLLVYESVSHVYAD